MWGLQVHAWLIRFRPRSHRRIIVACLITLLISGFLLGLIGFMRWRGQRALQSDTGSVVAQAGQQLIRSLESRRGTLTFIRDTLNRRADLSRPQLEALGLSATEHTRHLLGTGLLRASAAPEWWARPQHVSERERDSMNRAVVQRAKLRGVWRVPSTFVTTVEGQRTFLIMLEPLRTPVYPQSAIMGVFDLKPLLEDFFSTRVFQHPVQILDGTTLLYRSAAWQSTTETVHPITAEDPIAVDAARWTIQMQPGSTRVAQTLSWFNVLLVVLSLIAGLGMTIIVWILAARTWLLQRAVARRTAALRRTSERLRQLATTDELTGLYNRRFFLDRWAWECDRAKRYQRPLACLMVDVDGFKQVNDRLGHHTGDLVLKDVARELKAALRQSDILARFGGDEFIVALPETTHEQAEAVAQKLRQVSLRASGDSQRRVPDVRLSVGLSYVVPGDQEPEEIIQAADQSLYSAKRQAHAARSRTKHTPASSDSAR